MSSHGGHGEKKAESSSMAGTLPEVAPHDPRKGEPEANKLFRMVMKHEASDLHLKVGQAPMMRLRGDIRRADMPPMTQEMMEKLLLPLLTQRQRRILDEEGGVDYCHVVGND